MADRLTSFFFSFLLQRHRHFTVKQFERFKNFYENWIEKNVSDPDANDPLLNAWTNSHRFHPNDQQRFTVEAQMSADARDLTEPPYHHYRQYRLVDIEK